MGLNGALLLDTIQLTSQSDGTQELKGAKNKKNGNFCQGFVTPCFRTDFNH
jgi:hypothetical protein